MSTLLCVRGLLLNLQIQQFVAHALETGQDNAAALDKVAGLRLGAFRYLRHFPGISRRVGVGDVVARGIERALRRLQCLYADIERCIQSTHGIYTWQDQVACFNLVPAPS